MSDDSFKKRGKALEDSYFQKKEAEALQRLSARETPRKSPITGEPMEQLTMMGVVVDRCPSSGGIWLDAGELEQILSTAKSEETESKNFLSQFIGSLVSSK